MLSVKGEADKSTVEWQGAFYRGFMNNNPPPELSDEAAAKAVKGVYRGGLDALKEKVEAGGYWADDGAWPIEEPVCSACRFCHRGERNVRW